MSKTSFVEFNRDDICYVTQNKVEELIETAQNNPLKKFRFCLHQTEDATLHEMVIVTTKDDLKYPDKHMNTSESNIILKGKLLVALFDEEGNMQKSFILSPEETFYYRCEKNQYHMTLPLTDVAVYVEIKEGPFDTNANVFPDWAPDRQDRDKLRIFNSEIKAKALELLENGINKEED